MIEEREAKIVNFSCVGVLTLTHFLSPFLPQEDLREADAEHSLSHASREVSHVSAANLPIISIAPSRSTRAARSTFVLPAAHASGSARDGAATSETVRLVAGEGSVAWVADAEQSDCRACRLPFGLLRRRVSVAVTAGEGTRMGGWKKENSRGRIEGGG